MTQKTPDILKRIVARKCEEIDESINRVPIERMIELTKFADKTRGFIMHWLQKLIIAKAPLLLKLRKLHLVRVYCVRTLTLLK